MKGFIKVYIEITPDAEKEIKKIKRDLINREQARGSKKPKLRAIFDPRSGMIYIQIKRKGNGNDSVISRSFGN